MLIEAVIFDLDGVLIDSERTWSAAREQVTRARGGRWRGEAARAMMGMSSPEWSRYMHSELGVRLEPEQIVDDVLARMQALYRNHLPVIDGAHAALAALAARWRLGLASSANRALIELVLELAGWRRLFAATLSAEEVSAGKPAPDVYLHTAQLLSVQPSRCVAIEDSTNGMRAVAAAGMALVAIPNSDFAPAADALALADRVIGSLHKLRPELIEVIASRARGPIVGA